MPSVFLKGQMTKSSSVTCFNWFRLLDLSGLINLDFLISLCSVVCECLCNSSVIMFMYSSSNLSFTISYPRLLWTWQHCAILSWLAFFAGMLPLSFMILHMQNVSTVPMRSWKRIWWRCIIIFSWSTVILYVWDMQRCKLKNYKLHYTGVSLIKSCLDLYLTRN